jgi:pyruvate dehydrogenase E2 component (dihydrolipoamide acetyltransferase)
MGDFTMPSLGADMDSGTVVQWLVAPGQPVRRGDIVAIVDTDKADIEVEVFESGVVDEILVPEGERVPVGVVLARIRSGSAAPPAAVVPPAAPVPAPAAVVPPAAPTRGPARTVARPPSKPAARTPAARETAARRAVPGRPRVSPLARRRAADLGVDVAALAAAAPDRPVRARDVERAAVGSAPPAEHAAVAVTPGAGRPSAGVTAERLAAMRRATGALMERSKREVPHFYLATDVDLDRSLRWLAERNERRPVDERVVPAALLLKAVALALREVPDLNGFWIDGALHRSDAVHLGVAVALRQGGLLAPAIHDADRLALDDLMRALKDLVGRARAGSLRSSELADPTVTVTNLGDQGVRTVFPVIHLPQVAIVGFGRISDRPWAEAGMLGVRPVVTATLAADHRAVDGHTGARFLTRLERLLRDPEGL